MLMGRVTKVFASGTIGNVIFYERLGTACARSRPATVRQSVATKAAAGVFGRAKSISRQLREGLAGLLANPRAKEVMYVTDKAVATWLRTADLASSNVIEPPLSNIEFNSKTSIHERFKKQIGVDWSAADYVKINIPRFDPLQAITAPVNTISVSLQLAVSASSLSGSYVEGSETAVNIDYVKGNMPAKEIQLSFTTSPGCIYLVVAALKYMVINKGIKETVQAEQWLPVSVIGGYYKS
jgi:hypothetical protein